MSREIVDLLAGAFSLDQREQEILASPLRSLNRQGRRFYFSQLKPRDNDFQLFLRKTYDSLSDAGRTAWRDFTVASMLAHRGEPDLSDHLVLALAGRLTVYEEMRRRAQEEGVTLRSMTSFGGILLILYLFLIVALGVILLKYLLR